MNEAKNIPDAPKVSIIGNAPYNLRLMVDSKS